MDWDEAGSRADRRLWRAFFSVGVGLLVLAVINVAFVLSDPPANWWQYLYPVFSVLAGVAILIYSRKRYKS
ncbi:hypothetical protein D9M72_197780 [compost metagenome]